MNAIIVSDLHIGSRNFVFHEFKNFIDRIPPNYEIILNGDVIDDPKKELTPLHQRILDIIVRISNRQKVVWVHGNHDDGFTLQEAGKIEFKSTYKINNNLLVAHGHNYDQIMPMSKTFIKTFTRFHEFRIFLGAPSVHVSDYAKKWKLLYSILRKNVLKNAIASAKENDCATVACGHTHYPEDRLVNGIRYINTGSWTESPAYCIQVEGENIDLKRVGDCFMDSKDESLSETTIQAA